MSGIGVLPTPGIPPSCTCPWEKRAGDLHWRKLGTKEDCPWCTGAPPRPPRRDPHDYLPEWLDDDRGP